MQHWNEAWIGNRLTNVLLNVDDAYHSPTQMDQHKIQISSQLKVHIFRVMPPHLHLQTLRTLSWLQVTHSIHFHRIYGMVVLHMHMHRSEIFIQSPTSAIYFNNLYAVRAYCAKHCHTQTKKCVEDWWGGNSCSLLSLLRIISSHSLPTLIRIGISFTN